MKRRDFIRGAVATVPATVALTALNQRWAMAQSSDFDGPLDVLNYALTLEYLEAEFYRQGNGAGLLQDKEAMYLQKIGADEATHVTALTTTIQGLGGTPVAAPGVDFGQSFASRDSFLETAYVFENLGVGAYLGAAPSLFAEKELLSAAAGIFGIEARHAAIIGQLLGRPADGNNGVFQGDVESPLAKADVLAAATPFIRSGTSSGAPSSTGGSAAVTL